MIRKILAASAALALGASPVMAAASPTTDLAAGKPARVGTVAKKSSDLGGGGGAIVAIVAVIAVIAGVIIVADSDDTPDSR